jgi:hypothetical protein
MVLALEFSSKFMVYGFIFTVHFFFLNQMPQYLNIFIFYYLDQITE